MQFHAANQWRVVAGNNESLEVRSGVVNVDMLEIQGTDVISSSRQLQNIASLDSTTQATIGSALGFLTVDVLVVAGGGAGGINRSGGGGAGGALELNGALASGSSAIVIGGGGASSGAVSSGTNSSAGALGTATGGGRGATLGTPAGQALSGG